MDLSRAAYTRDLKVAAMRALDAGSATTGEIARKYQLSPKLLERWRGEWRARGELAFPGSGRRGVDTPGLDMPAASPSWNVRSASSPWRTTS
jgi:transposase-like protein